MQKKQKLKTFCGAFRLRLPCADELKAFALLQYFRQKQLDHISADELKAFALLQYFRAISYW